MKKLPIKRASAGQAAIVNKQSPASIKILHLRRVDIKKATASFRYEVMEGDRVLAKRESAREYIACFVIKQGDRFELPNFFSRIDLIGQGSSARFGPGNLYGIACINGAEISIQQCVLSLSKP